MDYDFQSKKSFFVGLNLRKVKGDCENISNENNQKMQHIIENSSENTFESEKPFHSQETISEVKVDTDFYTNETPRNIIHVASKEYPTSFPG